MILVDTSVWIDFFRDIRTAQTIRLEALFGDPRLAICDLVLAEILQGTRSERQARAYELRLGELPQIVTSDVKIAVRAASNYRYLRSKGVTVRGTIDVLIATRCIADGHALLFKDHDFDGFVEHLGLRSAMADIEEPPR